MKDKKKGLQSTTKASQTQKQQPQITTNGYYHYTNNIKNFVNFLYSRFSVIAAQHIEDSEKEELRRSLLISVSPAIIKLETELNEKLKNTIELLNLISPATKVVNYLATKPIKEVNTTRPASESDKGLEAKVNYIISHDCKTANALTSVIGTPYSYYDKVNGKAQIKSHNGVVISLTSPNQKAIKQVDAKLFEYLITQYTAEKPKDGVIYLNLIDYTNILTGGNSTARQFKKTKAEVKQSLALLKSISFSYTATIKGKPTAVSLEFVDAYKYHRGKAGTQSDYYNIKLNDKFLDSLRHNTPRYYLPVKIFTIDNRDNTAYQLARKLTSQHFNNNHRARGSENRLTVATVLKATNTSTKRMNSDKPKLERAYNTLIDIGIIQGYKFKPKDNKQPESYKQWKQGVIEVEFTSPPKVKQKQIKKKNRLHVKEKPKQKVTNNANKTRKKRAESYEIEAETSAKEEKKTEPKTYKNIKKDRLHVERGQVACKGES